MNIQLCDEIKKWADLNMIRNLDRSLYTMWEKIWCCHPQHRNLKLRLCHHDNGADIVILSCPGGYGATDSDWDGINVGSAKSVEQIVAIYKWLEEMSS